MQSVDEIGTYANGTSKDVEGQKEVTKCDNITKWYKNA